MSAEENTPGTTSLKFRGDRVDIRGYEPGSILNRQLSQQEIDAAFQNIQEKKAESPALKFDFRRQDRIQKSQIRAIHVVHDSFVRNLVSSLSAYLRSYLIVNLVSVAQLSYAEFLDGLPSPTCIVSLGLSPYDGNGILELSPTLVFPILEMLLGGYGKTSVSIQRDITEIEKNLLDGLFRIILNDLREAWKPVTLVNFTIESMETDPQSLHLMAPNEAVVSIGIELRIGDAVGMMNIAMPSVVIRMMRPKFDQQWSIRKTHASEAEQSLLLRVLRKGSADLEARMEGPTITVRDLLELRQGYLLTFDYPGGTRRGMAGQWRSQVFRPGGEYGEEAGVPAGENQACQGSEENQRRYGRRVGISIRAAPSIHQGVIAEHAAVCAESQSPRP